MLPSDVIETFPSVTDKISFKITSPAASITAPVAAVTAELIVILLPLINASASVVTAPSMLTSLSDIISALPVAAIDPVSLRATVFASILVVPPDETAPLIVVSETDVIVVFPVDDKVLPTVTLFAELRLIFPAAMAPSVIIDAFEPVVVTFKSFETEAVPRVRFLSAEVSQTFPLPSSEPFADILTLPFASTLIALPSAPILPAVEFNVMLLPAVRIALSLFCSTSFCAEMLISPAAVTALLKLTFPVSAAVFETEILPVFAISEFKIISPASVFAIEISPAVMSAFSPWVKPPAVFISTIVFACKLCSSVNCSPLSI